MSDRGKVMQWLETCANGCEDGCPYEYKNLIYRVECKADLMIDALELLKESEPIKPYAQGDGSFACDNCGETVGWEELNCGGISIVKYKFCPECGQAVKWDG